MADMILKSHRPYPVVSNRWTSLQTWRNLLFAHWEVKASELRQLVPRELELDLFEGKAYIGIVPFEMTNVRPRFMPALPFISTFPELNVRVYVNHNGKQGVYFLSLDADRLLFVLGGRFFYKLPYYSSKMKINKNNEMYTYSLSRRFSHENKIQFKASYCPSSDFFYSKEGSLEEFLTERYCLFTVLKNKVSVCEIDHMKWKLQKCTVNIEQNEFLNMFKLNPLSKPFFLYSDSIDVKIWNLAKARDSDE
jgi:uncharacterized protein